MTETRQAGRHSRTIAAGYDPDRLSAGCVLVVGAGALGQNVALDLALMGIGELRVVDVDRFEDHNRTRSPLYSAPTTSTTCLKAPAVARKLLGHMTAAGGLVRYSTAPVQDLGAGALVDVDVVVAAVDNAAARAWLSDLACAHGVDLVEGGFEGAAVSLSTFPTSAGPGAACWRCSNPALDGTFSCTFTAAQAEDDGIIPALQTGAAALGAMQAEAVAQALHGTLPGPRSVHLNVGTGRSRVVELSADPLCPGVHRRIGARECSVTVDDPVGALVAVAEKALGAGALIMLPQGFVRKAFCTRCGVGVRPGLTEAAWRITPRCATCGGTSVGDETVGVADVIGPISAASPPELLRTPGRGLGLRPGTVVQAIGVDGPALAFRLAGNPQTLFATAALDPPR